MRDLANSVGMEAASLYNHIKSKEDILKNICFLLADTYTSKMEEVFLLKISALEKIEKLLSLHIQINAMSSALACVMNDEWRHLSEPDRSKFLVMRHAYEDKFTLLIQQGIDQGEIKKLNPTIALFTLLSSVRWLQHWYYSNREFDVSDVKDNVMRMVFNGIVV